MANPTQETELGVAVTEPIPQRATKTAPPANDAAPVLTSVLSIAQEGPRPEEPHRDQDVNINTFEQPRAASTAETPGRPMGAHQTAANSSRRRTNDPYARALPNGKPNDEDNEETWEDLETVFHFWTGDDFPTELGNFRCGSGNPPTAAALTGADLTKILSAPPAPAPAMVTLAVVKTTLAEHKNIIKKLRDLPTKFHRMPLPSAIVEWITEMRNTRRWKWTTTLKQLALCQGALGLLPTYIHAEPIRLQTCPVWRQAVRGAAMMAKQEVPAQPLAITKRQMEETLDREKDPAIFSALLLSWATAARVGCVLLQLRGIKQG